MSAETDEIQYLREELEAQQVKVNELVMANQKLVSVNRNLSSALDVMTGTCEELRTELLEVQEHEQQFERA